MFNGVAAVTAEVVWELLQHLENILSIFLLLQKEKRAMPMQATETRSNVLLVFAATSKTLTWRCVLTVAWALPDLTDPGARRVQWGIWAAQGLVQRREAAQGCSQWKMWEWASQCRHHLGLLCKPALRWEPTVHRALHRTSPGEMGKGISKHKKWPSNGHRAGQRWGQEQSAPQIRLTQSKKPHQRKVKSKKWIYRISSVLSCLLGAISLIKMKTLLQNAW